MKSGQSKTKLSEYDFDLPAELIASYPTSMRDESRLLHYNLESKSLKHLKFPDIKSLLRPGDILVRNVSKVLPVRFRIRGLTEIEILLLKQDDSKHRWQAIAKPLKKIRDGIYKLSNSQEISISHIHPKSNSQEITINNFHSIENLQATDNSKTQSRSQSSNINKQPEISAQLLIDFGSDEAFNRAINEAAEMPIPPYLKRNAEAIDKERYQTVYAQESSNGFSIAAPTAGLHFTQALLEEIKTLGIEILDINLHVGLGTFLPIKSESIETHKMHSEYYEIPEQTWAKILALKSQRLDFNYDNPLSQRLDNNSSERRIIAIGTTAARALESAARNAKLCGETDLFIYPKHHAKTAAEIYNQRQQNFRIIDGLLTNFHLPKSTLLLLVSAFAGEEEIKNIYKEAINERYRFFSYGDAMLLL